MNPLKNKTFGRLVTEAASARHIDQLPNIRQLIYEILQEAKQPEKVNPLVWRGIRAKLRHRGSPNPAK